MADYGDVVFTQHDDGRVTVDRADDMIGISVELLARAEPGSLPVDGEGCIWLAGDSNYRYRPVRFDTPSLFRPEGSRLAGGHPQVVVCERVK